MSNFYNFGLQLSDLLRGLLRGSSSSPASQPQPSDPERGRPDGDEPEQAEFPPGGIDLLSHEVRINFNFGGRSEETITLHGSMVVQRDEARVGEDGLREVPFRVQSWVASGWSKVLNSVVTYTLTEGEEQPVSLIKSQQKDSDYPAKFLFNVLFDARVNNITVHKRQHGRPEGEHFRRVPPNGSRLQSPTITRFTDIGHIAVEHPHFGKIVAKPFDCNDRAGKTIAVTPGVRMISPDKQGD